MKKLFNKTPQIFSDSGIVTTPDLLKNWIELSKSAATANAQQFQQWLGPVTKISAVLKSNAYGHGLIAMATLYDECDAIATLSVINLYEAVQLRQHGIKKTILVIGYLDAAYDLIVKYDIHVVIYDLLLAEQLNEVGKKYNTQIIVHIKFDSGMHRLGILPDNLDQFIQELKKLPFITIQGIFSHFAQSYIATTTHHQEDVFVIATHYGLQTHISNSHGTLTAHHKNYTFARIGIGLYGYLQKYDQDVQNMLKPVLSLKTRILQIKQVKAGSFIGYDATYQAPTDITIAIIAIGYAEGLDARLSNCGSVMINDQFAPIIGRVCMNLTIVNISSIQNCSVGQVVTVLGSEKNLSISAYDWSALTQASAYNHLTKISSSLVKIIVD
ncbi:alanine racemase [Candidatus Chromulinivorax destructor]|uniref:Alanine racemase n=1 Tax=Candidatus Chromulinivorax destructor TaxID=2066483 RepID=A0A345ZBN2_9BACT|nr:alanine racemase [Candidatus Chromulinivorax destructor]AXK60699.1 alanine racemase [Candidatus Chromulinivorax destructor]